MRRFTLLLLSSMLAGSAMYAQGARPTTCGFSAPPLDRPAPVLLGWPDLESESLAPGLRREMRLHSGAAITAPDYSLRLADYGDRVIGEILVHWPGIDYLRVTGGDPGCQTWHEAERRKASEELALSYWAQYRCGPVRVVPRTEGCRVAFKSEPGWNAMLHRADSLGVWALDSLPTRLGLDGFGVSVEVRDHAGYRRYDYRNPDASGGEIEKQVVALADLITAALQTASVQARQQ